jgi:hypothetical protein
MTSAHRFASDTASRGEPLRDPLRPGRMMRRAQPPEARQRERAAPRSQFDEHMDRSRVQGGPQDDAGGADTHGLPATQPAQGHGSLRPECGGRAGGGASQA